MSVLVCLYGDLAKIPYTFMQSFNTVIAPNRADVRLFSYGEGDISLIASVIKEHVVIKEYRKEEEIVGEIKDKILLLKYRWFLILSLDNYVVRYPTIARLDPSLYYSSYGHELFTNNSLVQAPMCSLDFEIERFGEVRKRLNFVTPRLGIDKIDAIYYINLAHRTDRKKHIVPELKKIFPEEKIIRVDAFRQNFGAVGCSMSHILALKMFEKSKYETALIVEDDFKWYDVKKAKDTLNTFFNSNIPFDVLMISYAENCPSKATDYPFLRKVIESAHASGYIVNKKFSPILRQNFEEGVNLLKMSKDIPSHALDVYWFAVQKASDKWYHTVPKLGHQMQSFSDISKRVVVTK